MIVNHPHAEVIASELAATLEANFPESLLYCTLHPVPILEKLSERGCRVRHEENFEKLPDNELFELGVVFDALEHLSRDAGFALVGRLRNFHAKRLWIAVETSSTWNFTTMLGFGFKLANRYKNSNKELCTYVYDLANYNKKRDWNNPRFWANPDNWGKYRW